jgi:hypothetical protein
MRILRFQIRYLTGQTDLINVESERVLIGSGAHCEIRLPIDQARVEHLRIDLGPAGAFATALAFDPPPTLNGVPFTQSPLPPDGVLGVGQTQIQIQVVDVGGQAGGTQKEKKSSPVTLIAMAVVLIGAAFFLFSDDAVEEQGLSSPKQAALWPEAPAAACPKSGPEARELAWQRLGIANAKRERRPFYVQEGVAAVPLFELAASCFKAANDSNNGRAAEATATYLRADLNQDYRKQHVRLEYHVRTEDWTAARNDVRILLYYTDGQPSEYRTWLQEADRKLLLKAPRAPQ